MIENKKEQCKHLLLSSIATARGFKYRQDGDSVILETENIITKNHNTILKNLLGQTATVNDVDNVDTILNYIKKLPNYDLLISEARDQLIEEGVTLPEPNYIDTFQPNTVGWMRQLIDICK